MILKPYYQITRPLINEALEYAELSKSYTSDRHDFHEGGLDNKKQKMYEGKLGEKAFKMFLLDNKISFTEDNTPYTEADLYDFLLPDGLKIDVKTRTKSFHTRTLEMVEQSNKSPKDIYVSVSLPEGTTCAKLLGWFTRVDMLHANHIENNGYRDNYVMYDSELREIPELFQLYLKKHIIHN